MHAARRPKQGPRLLACCFPPTDHMAAGVSDDGRLIGRLELGCLQDGADLRRKLEALHTMSLLISPRGTWS